MHSKLLRRLVARTTLRVSYRSLADFGFQRVPDDQKQEKVNEVFHNVASKYDLMNDAMSFGVHRIWKDHFVRKLSPSHSSSIVDVAGGTGDIAFRIHRAIVRAKRYNQFISVSNPGTASMDSTVNPSVTTTPAAHQTDSDSSPPCDSEQQVGSGAGHVTVCDINQSMLDVGMRRCEQSGIKSGISWVCGNAEDLPFADSTFDGYTIAFGIRNCTHLERVLGEALRVLRPGGRFLCLEFSQMVSPLLQSAYDAYSFNVIPVLGHLIARDWHSYQYLVESIRRFPPQERFASMLRDAGFSAVTHENLSLGIAAIHSGFKLTLPAVKS